MAALLILVLAWTTLVVANPAPEAIKLAGLCAGLALALPLAQLPRPPGVLWLVALAWLPATLLSLDPLHTLLGSLARAQGLLAAFALLVLAWCAGGLDARARQSLLMAIAAIGALLGAYALLQRLGLDPLAWHHGDPGRPAATAGNAVTLAGWLVLALPMSWALWRQGALPRAALALLLALQAGGLLASGSRGAWLALLIATLAVALWRAAPPVRQRWLWAGLPVLLLGLGLATLRPQSIDDRLALWRAGVQAIVEPSTLDWRGETDPRADWRWLIGHGADRQSGPLDAALARQAHRPEAAGWRADRAHQAVIDRWLEAGLPGLLALALLAAALARALWQARGAALTPFLAVALLAWALHLQFAFALTADRTLAWLLIGLALRPAQPCGPRRPLATALPTLALLAGAGLAAGFGPARLDPARAAEVAFREGQARYRVALASASVADYQAAAATFSQALAQDRHDRDAALAAATAHAEACVRGSPPDCAAAQALLTRAGRLAPADPRLPALRARMAGALD
jgi:O-antigen ligase